MKLSLAAAGQEEEDFQTNFLGELVRADEKFC